MKLERLFSVQIDHLIGEGRFSWIHATFEKFIHSFSLILLLPSLSEFFLLGLRPGIGPLERLLG